MDIVPSMMQGFQGITMLNQGADLAVQGANYQAASFRTAGQLAIQGSHYSAEVLRRSGDIALQGAAYQKQILDQSKEIADEGGQYSAEVYANAGAAAMAVSTYNKALDVVDTNRSLDAMGRQMRDLFNSNTASMGPSGISLGSKSYLAVTSDVMGTYEKQLVQIRASALQRQQGIMYQGNVAATEYSNNSQAAKYSAQLAKRQYDNQIAAADYQSRLTAYDYNNQAVAAEFQGQVAAWNYESQAVNAEYQGQIASYQAGQQQAKQIGSMVGQITSLF